MADREAVQAEQLINALRDQLQQMETQLAKVERKGPSKTAKDCRPSETRAKAAELRNDIREAAILIERLRRRYLNTSHPCSPARRYPA